MTGTQTPAGLGRYLELARTRHAVPLIGWSLVARLPVGMTPLALLLLVRAEGSSYAAAAAVAGAYTVAVAIGAPVAGRLVDRRGPVWVLGPRAVAYPALLGIVAGLALAGASAFVLAPVAALAGLLIPPISSALRPLFGRVFPPRLVSSAFAIEAALQEVYFIVAPLLVALLVLLSPVAGVAGAAAAAAIGTLAFMRLAPVREARPAPSRHPGRLGPIGYVGVRTITMTAVCMGVGFGGMEVAMPAFAERDGHRALAGVALACFALGSLVGGLLAGLRNVEAPHRRLLQLSLVMPLLFAPVLAAGSFAAVCALIFVAGLPLAPMVANCYALVERIAPAAVQAETFAWFGTAVSTGIAGGTALGGVLVDEVGIRGALVLGVGGAAAASLVLLVRRATLAGELATLEGAAQPDTAT